MTTDTTGPIPDDVMKLAREFGAQEALPHNKARYLAGDWDSAGSVQSVARAIMADRAGRPSGDVAVKPLEWDEVMTPRSDEDPSHEPSGDYETVTAIGVYHIECGFGSDSYDFSVSLNNDHISSHDDPEEAKSAAQADFERRVLACISDRAADAGAGRVGEAVAYLHRNGAIWRVDNCPAGIDFTADGWKPAYYALPSEKPGEVERLTRERDELRMIVNHATAGRTDGTGMGFNDICVAITALRNELWHDARKPLEAALSETRERLEKQLRLAALSLDEALSAIDADADPVTYARIKAAAGRTRAALTGDAKEAGR